MKRRYEVLLEILLWFAALSVVGGTGFLIRELLQDDPEGIAVVGALGLILTQTVALTGLLMRNSAQSQAEDRLTQEAALKAVELVASDGSEGSLGRLPFSPSGYSPAPWTR